MSLFSASKKDKAYDRNILLPKANVYWSKTWGLELIVSGPEVKNGFANQLLLQAYECDTEEQTCLRQKELMYWSSKLVYFNRIRPQNVAYTFL